MIERKRDPEDVEKIRELVLEMFGTSRFVICFVLETVPTELGSPPQPGARPIGTVINGTESRDLRAFAAALSHVAGKMERIDKEKAKFRISNQNSVDK